MAVVRKVLAQSNPAADTDTEIYDVPDATEVVISSLIVANRSATPTKFRAWIRIDNAALDDKQYFAYDVPIEGNESLAIGHGITASHDDRFYVRADDATLSFTLYGQEIS